MAVHETNPDVDVPFIGDYLKQCMRSVNYEHDRPMFSGATVQYLLREIRERDIEIAGLNTQLSVAKYHSD